jgi:hypothetical protein
LLVPGRLTTWIGGFLLAATLALALASCGGDSPEATANAKPEAATGTGATATEAEPTRPKSTATQSRCAAQLGDLLGAMDGLRTELASGLAYEQYVGRVRKIVASYEELPVDELTLGCLRAAGTPGEKALNRYIAAGDEWSDCVEVPSCDAASIEAPLQAQWKQASAYLSKAQRGLRRRADPRARGSAD